MNGSTRIAGLVALAIMLVSFSGCDDRDLHVDTEDSCAWLTVNNYVAGGNPKYPDAGTRGYRTGILMQLGTYSGPDSDFKGIRFLDASGNAISEIESLVDDDNDGVKDPLLTEGVLLRGSFTWINVVSEFGGIDGAPVDPQHGFHFFNSASHDPTPCAAINECSKSGTSPECCPQLTDPGCLRNRKIHSGQTVAAFLTYWQGPRGFDLTVVQETGINNLINSLDFDFKDEGFVVEVYREVNGRSGWEMQLLYRSGVEDIGEVKVASKAKGPGGGTKQDPAWPPCQGGC